MKFTSFDLVENGAQRFVQFLRFIESVGFYDPITDPATINVNLDRARHWINNGAQPTDTVRSILTRAGVYAEAAE